MSITSKIKQLFKPMDLTKGCIWKTILYFCIPIFISVFFQQIYNISDAAIVGQTLSNEEIAGVNDTGALVFIIMQFAFGCTAGFSVVTAKKIGNNNFNEARKSFLTQIILSLIISIILTIVSIVFLDDLLSFIGVNDSSTDIIKHNVYKSAYTYLLIIFGGLIAQMFYNLIVSVLRSVGDSLTPLMFLIISALLNIGLDYLFIVPFQMGVAGAATATIIAQLFSCIACFTYTFIRYKQFRFKRDDFKITLNFVFEHLKLGLPLAFQFSILAIGLIVMQSALIAFDIMPDGTWVTSTPAQIGFATANKLGNFLVAPLASLGTGMLSFTGQNLGAKNYERIKKGFYQANIIMFIFAGIITLFGLLLTINGAYQYIFLSQDKITSETIRFGNLYLYSAIPAYFLLGILFVWRNMIQGVEKSLYPFLAGLGELIARIVICLYLPTLINGGQINSMSGNFAYFSVCFADAFAWIVADIIMIYPVLKYILKPAEIKQ